MMHEAQFLVTGDGIAESLRDLVEIGKARNAQMSKQWNDALALYREIVKGPASDVDPAQDQDRFEKFRSDTLCAIAATKARVEAMETVVNENATIRGDLADRIEANEQAVQSCISTLGELSKLVQTIAAKQPPEPASGFEPFVAKAGKITPFEKPL